MRQVHVAGYPEKIERRCFDRWLCDFVSMSPISCHCRWCKRTVIWAACIVFGVAIVVGSPFEIFLVSPTCDVPSLALLAGWFSLVTFQPSDFAGSASWQLSVLMSYQAFTKF